MVSRQPVRHREEGAHIVPLCEDDEGGGPVVIVGQAENERGGEGGVERIRLEQGFTGLGVSRICAGGAQNQVAPNRETAERLGHGGRKPLHIRGREFVDDI